MITAVISNVVKEETGVRVFAILSDNTERSYVFPVDQASEDTIIAAVKVDVDAANDLLEKRKEAEKQAETVTALLQSLQGKIIE